MIPVLPAKVP